MDYEHVTHDEKLQRIESAIADQEREHYRLMLERVANTGNPEALRNVEAQIVVRERALNSLRAERARERAVGPPTGQQEPPAGQTDATVPAGTPATP